MKHTTTNVITHRTCIKIKLNAIWAGVNSAVSTAAGSLLEVSTGVAPLLGWNFIAVGFDTNAGVSRVRTWHRGPDGSSTDGAVVSFTATYTDSSSFLMCIGG
jgi:hypothetical protein